MPGTWCRLSSSDSPMQQLVEPAVFAQDERVVEAGDQQDIVDLKRHQVLEAFEEALGTCALSADRKWSPGRPSPHLKNANQLGPTESQSVFRNQG